MMICCTLKLKPTPRQERLFSRWLWHLTGVFNWAVRKIELDAADRIYHSEWTLKGLLRGHSFKMGIPAIVMQETVSRAHQAWQRCFSGEGRKPHLKGHRNRLNSFVLRDGRQVSIIGRRLTCAAALGSLAFHRQTIPAGRIKRARIVRRSSGWYAVLTIDADLSVTAGSGQIGIDPGFSSLLTLSTGIKIEHARELEQAAGRLAQAQRGGRQRLTARLHERTARQRLDRNHKLSRRLVAENRLIAWSKDPHANIARRFGRSVHSSGHHQLREMPRYKCRAGGAQFIEVASRNSTRRCSVCQSLTGPTGWAGLKVRVWDCSACGAHHDRDVNAALNTLKLGLGISLKSSGDAVSGIVS